MKTKLFILIIISAILTNCTTTKQIGDVTMLSSRNIDSQMDYVLIRSYMGGTKKEIRQAKKSEDLTIEDALNRVVKATPGGEFLKNVKIYLVDGKFISIEGDVWGKVDGKENFRGFKKGDYVIYKSGRRGKQGEIISLKNDKVCLFQEFGQLKIIEIGYDMITKTSADENEKAKYIAENSKNGGVQNESIVVMQNKYKPDLKQELAPPIKIEEKIKVEEIAKNQEKPKIEVIQEIKEPQTTVKIKTGDKVSWIDTTKKIWHGVVFNIEGSKVSIVSKDKNKEVVKSVSLDKLVKSE